ncbi:glycoside hydrolase family 43 protein [Collybiopsis luxurians FD-317 M1]|uniref:Endo-1,5-alpha-L-arabinanase A n=1 Tax=Collybiopsis luxurians FD-317 M1 TaxID=944289 RepID=A0A0D0APG4_9AGAR|nr:glycoside hydrolase family 43 protein [Collybiopsis luxurians FD-317 M1]
MKFITPALQFSALSVLSTTIAATPNPIAGSNNLTVRDPAIWYNPELQKYIVLSTSDKINISTSISLTGSAVSSLNLSFLRIPWTTIGPALPNSSKINITGHLEAPDVKFVNGLYTMYYSVSTAGSQKSAIGVATSPTMSSGNWTDLGEVISSAPGYHFNAIGPDLFNDNGSLRLSFGSCWDGMYQIGIGPGLKNHTSLPGTKIAGHRNRSAEGPVVYKPSDQPYYYCFFTDGKTPLIGEPRPPVDEVYKIIMGHGKDVQGPFYDKLGNDLTKNTTVGTILLASHGDVFAPGAPSIISDPNSGRDVMAYRFINKSDPPHGPSYLGINYLDFSSGWPVVVD